MEELAHDGDAIPSLGVGQGREIAQEIERIFEAKVSPRTILTKVARANKHGVSNETPHAAHTPTRPEAGCTGCNIALAKVVEEINVAGKINSMGTIRTTGKSTR